MKQDRIILTAPKRSATKGKVDNAAVVEAEIHGWKLSKCTDPIFWIWWESIFFNPAALSIGVDLRGNLFPMRKETNLLFSFFMFFEASVFQFPISSGASFITRGFRCIT